MAVVRCRAVIHGRVQGVFYRDSCQSEARRRGVTGWVRNNHNGTVEVVAEGERADVDALLDWCRSGPPRAAVTRIDVTDEDPVGESQFRVRHTS
ncbi:acylphosphatase [Ilumatobacter nonamiensis]|uniref:acylphosphatase n=1 Tax=Ilumatobacter nonamiensis TaxID=467093 RepID=UPI0003483980|nr:acylphosphatase [Ilumatobacter nonamiensis]